MVTPQSLNNPRRYYILSILALLLSLGVVSYIYNKLQEIQIPGWSENIQAFPNSTYYDKEIKTSFTKELNTPIIEKYNQLFKYFARGAYNYKSKSNALIYYPGAISSRGRTTNAIEGFARFFPLAASWLYSENPRNIQFKTSSYNLITLLKAGILAGTNRNHPEYWGDIQDKDQRVVEAADIALGLWLSKSFIWEEFTLSEKKQIYSWLEQAINKEIVDNNWNLFPIIIIKSLEALGFKNDQNSHHINSLYNSYKKKHYLGDGWFDDPPKGIDYYNAWSIHYTLFWIDQIDPNFDHNFIKTSLSDFLKFYKYLFSENGFPIMGRSVCYRMAAPSPIIAGAILLPNEISPGFALNTLDATWSFFIAKNALKNGKVTQGYFEDDLSLLDSYSGAGSCLWSLRSLVLAFYADKHISLFNSEKELLPVQISDFVVNNKTIGWNISGNKSNQKITLKIQKNFENPDYTILPYGLINSIKEKIFKRPFRPNNSNALYKNYIYTTDVEFLNKP
ncbi:DUF2264 domain-containing protein [Formosa sp. S-31]|uniref:DUF2264 domain-containing protein n=1 Tax=Formosa sp. S-31 TaxID=2790949 RepID=UPI003EB852D6